MKQPLLSITIPTWNRAEILEKALSQLLPQLINYTKEIELIVSDNCSTDKTNSVIESQKEKFKQINFIHFKQSSNTGYYGNFRKCKELANGKYFWLLSDNEFINDGLIEFLIGTLKEATTINSIHLNDWGNFHDENSFKKTEYRSKLLNANELFKVAGYKLTLISSVVFVNKKEEDDVLFEKFNGNSFLGFALFLKSLTDNNQSVLVSGKSLLTYETKISFNVFKSFTIDMSKCIDEGLRWGVFNSESSETFINNIIYNLTRHHYTDYKIQGKIYGLDLGPIQEIDNLLESYLAKYSGFQKYLKPIKNSSVNKLKMKVIREKANNKFNRIIKKVLLC